VSRLEALEQLYREGVKLAEEELKILNEEPDDLIRNLEMLASIRAAFEADAPRSSTATAIKPRGLKRRFDAADAFAADSPAQTPEVSTPAPASRAMSKVASRSGSVAASSIKAEATSESGDAMDGTSASKSQSNDMN